MLETKCNHWCNFTYFYMKNPYKSMLRHCCIIGVSAGLAAEALAFDLAGVLAIFVILTLYKSKGCECSWHLTMWPMELPD